MGEVPEGGDDGTGSGSMTGSGSNTGSGSGSGSGSADDTAKAAAYTSTIMAIFTSKNTCSTCHPSPQPGPDFSSYAALKAGGYTVGSATNAIISITPAGQEHENVVTYMSAADELTVKNWLDGTM